MDKNTKPPGDARQDGPQGVERLNMVEFDEQTTRPTPVSQCRIFEGNSAASQRVRILRHLKELGSLTTLQARHELDIMHPSMRVLELRKAGYPIGMVWCQDSTPEGNLHRVARYILEKKRQLCLPGLEVEK